MDFPTIMKKINNGEAFIEVFSILDKQDAVHAAEIRIELQEVIDRTSKRIFTNEKTTKQSKMSRLWEQRSSILQEMLNLNAHLERYTAPIVEYSSKEAELRQCAPSLVDGFCNYLSKALDKYFAEKQRKLDLDIDSEVAWTTEIKDVGATALRKSLDVSVKIANTFEGTLKNLNTNWANKTGDLVKNVSIQAKETRDRMDSKDTLARIWDRHMSNESIEIERKLLESWLDYEMKWTKIDAYMIEGEENISLTSSVNGSRPKMGASPAMQVGTAGAGIAGGATISLAMGWHTFGYAIFHVFPPALIFSMIAATAIGIGQESAYKNNIKDQFSNCLRLHRQQYVQLWFECVDEKNRDQLPLRTAIMLDAENRIEKSLSLWQQRLFGNLNAAAYKALIMAIKQHVSLLADALELIDKSLEAESHERSEYPILIGTFTKKYPTLDHEAVGMLATGEMLLKMHNEDPFPECSPLAIPFTKVLEHALCKVFGNEFDLQVRQIPQIVDKRFMLGTFLKLLREHKIRGNWDKRFEKNLNSANDVRRDVAHRAPISYEKARLVRDLTIGEQDLIGSIQAMA